MTGRRGRRRRKLLDDLKERRGYSHLKEEARRRQKCYDPPIIPNFFATSFNSFKYTSDVTHFISV